MTVEAQRPLVVTLGVEPAVQERWDRERAALFPAGRTEVGAHVTLFHALPAALGGDVELALARAADRPAFAVRVTEVMSLGRGAAYRLESPELAQLHAALVERWRHRLTRQDAQRLRAHVTVQNKVDPDEARATLGNLRAWFQPEEVQATGLDLYRYDGGPWTLLRRFPFSE